MRKYMSIVSLLVWMLTPCLPLSAQPAMPPVMLENAQGEQERLYAESHALLIGVSRYKRWNEFSKQWSYLPGVESDIRDVSQALQQHGFQTHIVLNPSGAELRRAFDDFIVEYGQHYHNRLLFYYAGHGTTITFQDGRMMGYLVPVDAPKPEADQSTFLKTALDMLMIETYAERIQSKHALFLLDNCNSGSVFHASKIRGNRTISHKANQPVRQVIASGGSNENVPDESVFRKQFVAALQGEGDLNGDGYMTGNELGLFLEDRVLMFSDNTQHPQYGKVRKEGLERGDFVFQLPAEPEPSPTPEPAVATPRPAQPPDLKVLKQWQDYQRNIDAYFKQIEEFVGQDGTSPSLAAEAWQQFLAYAGQDNPYSDQDERLRQVAQNRLDDLMHEPLPESTREPTASPRTRYQLRNQAVTVNDVDEAKRIFDVQETRRSWGWAWIPRQYIENKFEAQGKLVVDRATGLMWQQSGSENFMSYQEAQEYIRTLNRELFGGYSDWRLPTVNELMSLMEEEENEDNADLYISTFFDKRQWWCWSSDKRSSKLKWAVNFYGGVHDPYLDGRYVRAVRP